MSDAESKSSMMIQRDDGAQVQRTTTTVEIEVPQWMYDEAQQASECWSPGDTTDSIRDHLLDRIEVSPVFLVDGEPIGEK